MKALSDRISEFETSCDPNKFTWSFKGHTFEVYPWIKPYLFSKIQLGNKPKNSNKSIGYQVRVLFKGIFRSFRHNKTVIFSTSLERRALKDGIYDKLFHSIGESEALQPAGTIELMLAGSKQDFTRYKDTRVKSRSMMLLKETIYSKLFLRNLPLTGFYELERFLEQHGIEKDIIAYAIRKNYAQYRIMKKWLKRHSHLEQIFLSVSYTNFGRIIACKEKGVKVIELQHGVIGREHYGYSYYYDPVIDQFPDHTLSFGERDREFLSLQPFGSFGKVRAIGSFILEYYNSQHEERLEIGKIRSVAVSLQDCETGVRAVEGFIELATQLPQISFYFKRRNLDQRYYDQFSYPANVFFEEDRNVYELIVACDLHLTAYSSCAMEAISLGRPNMLYNLDDKAKAYYSDKLPASVWNHYCESIQEMVDEIRSIENLNTMEMKESNADNFKPNYHENLTIFLKELNE